MFLTTAIAGFIPLKVNTNIVFSFCDFSTNGMAITRSTADGSHCSRASPAVSFMGTCFLDIIPHINENYEDFKVLSGTDFEFPLPQFFTCIGFFIVYLIEEVCIKGVRGKSKHDHGSTVEVEKPAQKDNLNLRNTQALLGLMSDEELKAAGLPTHSLVMEETANYAVAESSEASLLKSLTFAVAMSFHSILEGFALGVQNTTA
ncbi:hypothetical protein OSTOST_10637 [Ostertagia ostertagi]